MNEFIVVPKGELRNEIIDALKEFEVIKTKSQPSKLWYINQVAKRLGKHHSTIKRLVEKGVIHSTVDGKISEEAVEKYLNR